MSDELVQQVVHLHKDLAECSHQNSTNQISTSTTTWNYNQSAQDEYVKVTCHVPASCQPPHRLLSTKPGSIHCQRGTWKSHTQIPPGPCSLRTSTLIVTRCLPTREQTEIIVATFQLPTVSSLLYSNASNRKIFPSIQLTWFSLGVMTKTFFNNPGTGWSASNFSHISMSAWVTRRLRLWESRSDISLSERQRKDRGDSCRRFILPLPGLPPGLIDQHQDLIEVQVERVSLKNLLSLEVTGNFETPNFLETSHWLK